MLSIHCKKKYFKSSVLTWSFSWQWWLNEGKPVLLLENLVPNTKQVIYLLINLSSIFKVSVCDGFEFLTQRIILEMLKLKPHAATVGTTKQSLCNL